MPLPTIGATPQNQQDALPLLTTAQATAPGEIQIVGNTLTRYWNAGATGINAQAAVADGNGFIYCKGGWLDVRGCSSFVAIVRRGSSNNTALGAIVGTINLGFQIRFDPAALDPPLSKGVAQNMNVCGATFASSTSLVYPAMQAAGETQDDLVSFARAQANFVTTGAGGGGMIGTDVRLFIAFQNAPAATSIWSVTMWGSQY